MNKDKKFSIRLTEDEQNRIRPEQKASLCLVTVALFS